MFILDYTRVTNLYVRAHDMGRMQSIQLRQGGRRMSDNVNDKLLKVLGKMYFKFHKNGQMQIKYLC